MIEQLILSNLALNEEYARKILPFVKEEYFSDNSQRVVYKLIKEYIDEYNRNPTREALIIDLGSKDGLNTATFEAAQKLISALDTESHDMPWLIDKTERFCQDKAIYNAIMASIKIMENKNENHSRGAIPQLLSDALGVSFDSNIGHDFLEDFDSRFDFYHRKEERIPFRLSLFNLITKNGLPRKTLNVILAGTGVGKSLAMCSFAADNLLDGKNVLYITMEMSEEKIAERIDANLLDVDIQLIENLPRDVYDKKVAKVKNKTVGKMIIKEFPTASAHAGHFRHLLNELRLKKNFVPDMIYIDYLNICASSRIKQGGSVNSYTYIKSIAEELRGLAVEFDVPVVTATQTTRGGYENTDVSLTDTSESFGLPATADLMFAIITSEQLEQLGQLMIKQLKNRYNDPSSNRRFVIGVERSKMRLYDVEQSAQTLNDADKPQKDVPAFDNSAFGQRLRTEKPDKNKFEKLNF
jgi:replicative DNA helicase